MPIPARILGTGEHHPARFVASADLDVKYNRPRGTTFDRSGVASRRWIGPGETSSSMAASALREALHRAGLDVSDLDAVIVSSVAPEQPMPTTAVLTLAHLGVRGGQCEAFDINASCVGFLTGLQTAACGVASGRWGNVAVISSEVASVALNHQDIESSALFGDGAAAVIVGSAGGSNSRIHSARSRVWPEVATACRIDAGGTRWNAHVPPADPAAYFFRMEGMALLLQVARRLPGFLKEFETGSLPLTAFDVVVPHQASGAGMRYLKERVGVKPESVIDILSDHGNQVSASIPTALHHAIVDGRLSRGDDVLLLGTGAGLALSAVALRY